VSLKKNSSNIKMTTTHSAIRSLLREALATTPPVVERGRDDKEMKTTVPSLLPIEPSDQVALQLSTQRPPVEDPEFVPANQKELGLAIDSLSSLVPDDKVGKVYKMFVDIIDKMNEETEEVKTGE
jgi:hypothetical protein